MQRFRGLSEVNEGINGHFRQSPKVLHQKHFFVPLFLCPSRKETTSSLTELSK